MSKVVDIAKVQRALDRAARNAQSGSSDVRSGKYVAGRHAAGDQLRREADPARQAKKK
jgi:hypothetical protein